MDNKMVVGQIVHYKVRGECRAAIVVKVWNQKTVNLAWFGDQSTDREPIFGNQLLGIDKATLVKQGNRDDRWHWPSECPNK